MLVLQNGACTSTSTSTSTGTVDSVVASDYAACSSSAVSYTHTFYVHVYFLFFENI